MLLTAIRKTSRESQFLYLSISRIMDLLQRPTRISCGSCSGLVRYQSNGLATCTTASLLLISYEFEHGCAVCKTDECNRDGSHEGSINGHVRESQETERRILVRAQEEFAKAIPENVLPWYNAFERSIVVVSRRDTNEPAGRRFCQICLQLFL